MLSHIPDEEFVRSFQMCGWRSSVVPMWAKNPAKIHDKTPFNLDDVGRTPPNLLSNLLPLDFLTYMEISYSRFIASYFI